MNDDYVAHERLVKELNNDEIRSEYAAPLNHYKAGIIPLFLGKLLVLSGNLLYGRKPSYTKFKAIEIIARIPYQSWEAASYTLLTAFHTKEDYAIELCRMSAFGRFAQDNETLHVVVISGIVRKMKKENFFMLTLIPLLFSLVYFWIIYFLYLFSPRASLELNYVFESHAYHQYQEFLTTHADELKKKMVNSEFLNFYGRHVRNEYELFESIRNDELIHRNRSIREIKTSKS